MLIVLGPIEPWYNIELVIYKFQAWKMGDHLMDLARRDAYLLKYDMTIWKLEAHKTFHINIQIKFDT